MKKAMIGMSLFGLIVSAGLFFNSCSQNTANAEVTANSSMVMDIDGMMCSKGCVKTINEALNTTEGVASAEVNFEEGTATVKYNDKLTSEASLLAMVGSLKDGQYTASLHEEGEKEMTPEEKAACMKKCKTAEKECTRANASAGTDAKNAGKPECKKVSRTAEVEEKATEKTEETESETVGV